MSTKRFVTMRRVKRGGWEAAGHFDEFADAVAAVDECGAVIDIDVPGSRSFWQPGAFSWQPTPPEVDAAFQAREF